MPISKSQLEGRTVFVDYVIDEVFLRYDPETRTFFLKFYGSDKETEVPFDDEGVNDALRYGEEISEAAYSMGRPLL